MSLDHTPPAALYNLGVIAAKDFDSHDLLTETLGPKLPTIRHLYTNGANGLITDFARENGITHTVFPITGGRGLPASTRDIVDASEVVLIIATPLSKSAKQVEAACAEKEKKSPEFKWRVIQYDPIDHWRSKVCKIAEIVAGMPEEERVKDAWAKAVWRIL